MNLIEIFSFYHTKLAFSQPHKAGVNPWINYFRNEEFRQAFCRTFHWLPSRLTVENAQEHGLKPDRNRMVRNSVYSGNLTIKVTEL